MKLRTLMMLPLAMLLISGCTGEVDSGGTTPSEPGKSTTTPSASSVTPAVEPYKSIEEIRNGEEAKQAVINARVVSKGVNRFIAYDGTGLILCYGASQTNAVNIGSKYTISGDLVFYDETIQFSHSEEEGQVVSTFTVSEYAGDVPEFTITPTIVEGIDAFANKTKKTVEYVTVPEVILYKSGNYVNSFSLTGDINELSVNGLSTFLSQLDGTSKERPWTYRVVGFLTGTNSNSRRVSMMASEAVTKVEQNAISIAFTDSNASTYTLNSIYDDANGLEVKINYQNGMVRTLNKDEFTYTVYDSDNNPIDTSILFPGAGNYSVVIQFGSLTSSVLNFTVDNSESTVVSKTANELGERNEWKTGNTSNKDGTMDDVVSLHTEGSGTGKWSSTNGTWSITQKATTSGAGKDGGYLEISVATGYVMKWIKITYSPTSGDAKPGHFENIPTGERVDMEEGCVSFKDFVKGETEDITDSTLRIREIVVAYEEVESE